MSTNYRGSRTRADNISANIPDDQNTSVWIQGLPPTCGNDMLLGRLKDTGKIFATVINQPVGLHPTCAAKVVFWDRSGVDLLLRKAARGEFVFPGNYSPTVELNRIKTCGPNSATAEHGGTTLNPQGFGAFLADRKVRNVLNKRLDLTTNTKLPAYGWVARPAHMPQKKKMPSTQETKRPLIESSTAQWMSGWLRMGNNQQGSPTGSACRSIQKSFSIFLAPTHPPTGNRTWSCHYQDHKAWRTAVAVPRRAFDELFLLDAVISAVGRDHSEGSWLTAGCFGLPRHIPVYDTRPKMRVAFPATGDRTGGDSSRNICECEGDSKKNSRLILSLVPARLKNEISTQLGHSTAASNESFPARGCRGGPGAAPLLDFWNAFLIFQGSGSLGPLRSSDLVRVSPVWITLLESSDGGTDHTANSAHISTNIPDDQNTSVWILCPPANVRL
ncbi:hypothetical protein F5Y17DRAFT_454850 [Xylariaceae sp. FL0594]|nr:hypothetical protein F5Y17DRAFT_454850 [Xylariaceae sp. FL0594]